MKQKKILISYYFLVTLFLYTAFAGSIFAQGGPAKTDVRATGNLESAIIDTSKTDKSEAKAPAALTEYFVLSVHLAGHPDIHTGGLGDDIDVVIDSLPNMIARYGLDQINHYELYIDGKRLKGLYGEPQNDNKTIRYSLIRRDSSSEGWQSVLKKPTFFDRSKPVNITIGHEQRGQLKTAEAKKNFEFVIVKPFNLILFIAVLILFGFLVWYLGKTTAMLREPGLENAEPMNKPYSLAFVQMTFWFFLVVTSTLMLWMITREFPVITGSVLILMGVSAVTALSSASVNLNRKLETESNNVKLGAEDKMLRTRITELEEKIKALPDGIEKKQFQTEWEEKTKRLNELAVILAQIPETKKIFTTKGFWKDLITEDGNVSLNRFQIGVWTVVLGAYFIFCAWSTLALPQFNDTLLTLMGISSGTYIGFKIQANKT